MANVTTATKHLTYTDYLKSPEINLRYEIIDGEMIMAPSLTVEHPAWVKSSDLRSLAN